MDTNSTGRGFIPYPTNRVVGTIADAEHADAAVKALVEAGFDRQSIDVLHGDEDLSRLDPTGAEHGVLERLQRALIRTGGPAEEYKHLMHHVEDVRAGRFVSHGPGATTRRTHRCRRHPQRVRRRVRGLLWKVGLAGAHTDQRPARRQRRRS